MNATQQLHAPGQSLWLDNGICALPASETPARFIDESPDLILTTSGVERWLGHVFNLMEAFIVATGAFTLLTMCRSHSVCAARCIHAT